MYLVIYWFLLCFLNFMLLWYWLLFFLLVVCLYKLMIYKKYLSVFDRMFKCFLKRFKCFLKIFKFFFMFWNFVVNVCLCYFVYIFCIKYYFLINNVYFCICVIKRVLNIYMVKDLLIFDYIFEVSWEVCNKVGGIYIVLFIRVNML